MKAFLENFGAIVGSASLGLLLISVAHEYGYFWVVGYFQTFLGTSDYFNNAILWVPAVAFGLLTFVDWDVLLETARFN
jgi:hypothetical protein